MTNKETWDEFMRQQAEKLWADTVKEVETTNRHASLSGTYSARISGLRDRPVRRSQEKGHRQEGTPVQSEVQREGNNDYHGASKTKATDLRRNRTTILRKRSTHK